MEVHRLLILFGSMQTCEVDSPLQIIHNGSFDIVLVYGDFYLLELSSESDDKSCTVLVKIVLIKVVLLGKSHWLCKHLPSYLETQVLEAWQHQVCTN